MLILLFLLCVIAAVLAMRRRFRAARAIAAIGFFFLVASSTGFLPRLLLSDLQGGLTGDIAIEFAPKNTIILLGLGTEDVDDGSGVEVGTFAFGRLMKSLEVYKQCVRSDRECRLLISGGDPQGHGRSEAEIYAAKLEQLGVLRADLVIESKSRNTWENAANSAPLTVGSQKVFLVTSGIHMKRSLVYFRHFGVTAIPVRADYLSIYSAWPQFYNGMVCDLATHEYIGMARYWLYNRLGLNPPPKNI